MIGLIGGGAQWLMTEALRVADTSVVMPIDFCKLPWTALLAFLIFARRASSTCSASSDRV
jgi:uncharacterized membrane protein